MRRIPTNMPGLQQQIYRTDRMPFHIRFQEHFRDYKYENNNIKFTQHLLDNKHFIDPMENIVNIICIANKGKMLKIPWENYIFIKKQQLTTK